MIQQAKEFIQSPDLHPLACTVRDCEIVKEVEIKKLSEAGSCRRSVVYYLDDKLCVKVCRVFKVGEINPITEQEIKTAEEAETINAQLRKAIENEYGCLL